MSAENKSFLEQAKTVGDIGTVAIGFFAFMTGNPALFAAAALDGAASVTFGDRAVKGLRGKSHE